jgi:ParB-like chromosome segregation protein Spo0J
LYQRRRRRVDGNRLGTLAQFVVHLDADRMLWNEKMTEQINVADIVQSTPARYPHIVRAYADRLAAGEVLKPVLVSRNSRGLLVIVEGNHRLEAHRIAGCVTIAAFAMSVN